MKLSGKLSYSKWEKLFVWSPSLQARILISALITAGAFSVTWLFYGATGIYFSFITILSIFIISLFAKLRVALFFAAILSMANDYFFIPPIGSIFDNPASLGHFFVMCSAAVTTAFFVSSLRSALAKLAVAKQNAEHATLNMEKILALVAHDIRNPIGTAKMATQAIIENPNEAENLSFVAAILRNLDQADSLIQSLLDVSSIRMGNSIPLSFHYCDLSVQVGQVVEEMSLVNKNRLKFITQGSAWGYWGTNGIRRALQNLISNALKYGDPKQPIQIALSFDDEKATISVQNQGNEIAKENQDQLFDFFNRGTLARNSVVKGWGLGLALVKGVASSHGGFVNVESGSGHGTKFNLTISSKTSSRPRDKNYKEKDNFSL